MMVADFAYPRANLKPEIPEKCNVQQCPMGSVMFNGFRGTQCFETVAIS